MSISPAKKEEEVFSPSLAARATKSTKIVVTEFFIKPHYYLFWGLLTATTIGLFCGMAFNWQVYALLAGLAIIEIFYEFKKVI